MTPQEKLAALLYTEATDVAMEAWHSAVDDAGELRANAPDERYASRAARVESWIKANRPVPPTAPVVDDAMVDRALAAYWGVFEKHGAGTGADGHAMRAALIAALQVAIHGKAMTDTFDAVLAEMHGLCEKYDAVGAGHAAQPIREFAARLAAAHAAEVVRLRTACDKWSELDSLHGSHKDLLARAEAAEARVRELEVACAQAVEFAQYVEDAAKGRMVEKAQEFLSLEYSQELAARLARSKPE